LDAELIGAWHGGVGAELGWVWLPVTGQIQNEADIAVERLWSSFELGIGRRF
jgi:hypothetical protein